ncbi:MAG: DNA polymerase III subunit delta [Deltaproteobacteria bacterium]
MKTPGTRYSAYLLHGTDAGLVSERGMALAKAVAEAENPPGEIVRLNDADVETDPERLSLELLTIPMFGGRKIVRAEMGRRINSQMIKPLLEAKSLAGVLIVEAGNLRRDDSLRSAFEKSANAAAIACYLDEDRDLGAIIQDVLKPHNLSISPGARQQLIMRLGADRVLSRGEIEKLALYAHGQREITEDDVEAVVADAAELTLDRVVNAAAAGERTRAVEELHRALAAGENAQSIILALQRHFTRLHRLAAVVRTGKSIDQAVTDLRPPLHFKQADALKFQLRHWQPDTIEKALQGIAQAARSARRSSILEDLLAERLILSLSGLARPQT